MANGKKITKNWTKYKRIIKQMIVNNKMNKVMRGHVVWTAVKIVEAVHIVLKMEIEWIYLLLIIND
jgi:hypothetical protein